MLLGKLSRKFIPLFLLIAVNLLIGLATVQQFSESWDEASLFVYAEQALLLLAALWVHWANPVYTHLLEHCDLVLVLASNYEFDFEYFLEAEIVYTVEREGAALTLVKRLTSSE